MNWDPIARLIAGTPPAIGDRLKGATARRQRHDPGRHGCRAGYREQIGRDLRRRPDMSGIETRRITVDGIDTTVHLGGTGQGGGRWSSCTAIPMTARTGCR